MSESCDLGSIIFRINFYIITDSYFSLVNVNKTPTSHKDSIYSHLFVYLFTNNSNKKERVCVQNKRGFDEGGHGKVVSVLSVILSDIFKSLYDVILFQVRR